jgi:tetratricopeptide (TPR) repeat protein
MKLLLTLVVALLSALGASRWAGAARGTGGTADHDREHRVLALTAALERTRTENARIAAELERRADTLVAAAAPAAEEVSAADVAAALARWRAAHPDADRALRSEAVPLPRTLPAEAEIARIPMAELVQHLSGEGLTDLERQEVFERLREAGRIDEYVQAIEALAAADPENADLQVALGHAYLQKLFGVSTPEAGTWALKSDAAFDRALELDEENWGARFSKAVALSNWPAFMGRGPEAIEHFETLLEQQAEAPEQRDEYAMTYLFLGNMYQAAGDTERAVATWKAGLALFPGSDDLARALELAGGDARR